MAQQQKEGQGYLEKFEYEEWSKFWYEIKDMSLFEYQKESGGVGEEQLDVFDMSTLSNDSITEFDRYIPNSFQIVWKTKDNQKEKLILKASSDDEMRRWTNAFLKQIIIPVQDRVEMEKQWNAQLEISELTPKFCSYYSVKDVGISTDANPRCRPTMEDEHVVIDQFAGEILTGYFGVYDGHGGRTTVEGVKEKLHLQIEKHIKQKKSVPEALKESFLSVDAELVEKLKDSKDNSGSTGCSAVIRKEKGERKLYLANIGDTRAVLCRNGKAERLTVDHNAGSNTEEVQRIKGMGGFVFSKKVAGVLSVTRAFGDYSLKDWVPAEPQISETTLKEGDDYLIVACDGLWDVTSDQEAVDILIQQKTAQKASNALLSHALKQGTRDNVSIIVIFLGDNARPSFKSQQWQIFRNGIEEYVTPQNIKHEWDLQARKEQLGKPGPTKVASRPHNLPKSRDPDCLPLDRNRLRLKREINKSDYINASPIKLAGLDFIVTQHPVSKEFESYFQMIWDNTTIVVHLTVSPSNEDPWPKSGLKAGAFLITYESDRSCDPRQTLRQFKYTLEFQNEKKLIYVYKFMKWQDEKTLPPSSEDYMNAISRFSQDTTPFLRKEPFLLVSHDGCSATGVFLSLYTTFLQLNTASKNPLETPKLNILGLVDDMRSQRRNTIRTLQQYEFLYEAIKSYIELLIFSMEQE